MTYITVDDVRRASGAPSSLISNEYITSFIALVEDEMERWLNTKFTPTERIDHLDGSGSLRVFTEKNPVLSVRSLKTNATTITPAYLDIYRESGKISLNEDAETSTFISKRKDTWIKYIYGMVKESSTNTTSTAATTAGTSVEISVSSVSGFAVGNWVDVYGMDGNKEIAQITVVGSSSLTVDELVQAHESGSTVVKMEIPAFIKRYMELEAALAVAINAIGSTYTFNASYSLGELSVVKGVPYTHWRESTEKILKERDMRRKTIRPRPAIYVS